MGIMGMWNHMVNYGEAVELTELRGLKLVVDGHVWLYESKRGCDAHSTSPTYLATFFNRCQRLRENGIEPVFVFDSFRESDANGNEMRTRTRAKSSKRLEFITPGENKIMVDKIKTLLSHMGIPCYSQLTTPKGCDGEAQCAQLEQAGLVDGCITADFDYFLYGGRKLYRVNFTDSGRSIESKVARYTMDMFEKTQNLTRSRLIALAMLMGCDYFEGGISRIGVVTALEILSEFSFHEHDHPMTILDRFASYCRHELPERETDSAVKRKIRRARFDLPYGFPNTDEFRLILEIFIDPDVQIITSLPKQQPVNTEALELMLQEDCGWSQKRVEKELNRSKKRKSNTLQTKMTAFFPTKRRRSPVLIESKKIDEESSRKRAALEKLLEKSGMGGTQQSSTKPTIASSTHTTVKRRSPKISILNSAPFTKSTNDRGASPGSSSSSVQIIG